MFDIPFFFIFSKITPHSQIPRDIAQIMGLKSHKNVVGVSILADGSPKMDYLCEGEVSINGVVFPLVIKVGDSKQPLLIGLDVIHAGSMVLDFLNMTYTHSKTPIFDPSFGFKFLNYRDILHSAGLHEEDLVPVELLPDPDVAYAEAKVSGQSGLCVFLGTSSAVDTTTDWSAFSD